MRRIGIGLFVALAVWAVVPGWSGEAHPPRLGKARMIVERVALDPRDPARRRVGRLTFLGGLQLASPDPAFGGFSALSVGTGGAVTLVSDGGNVVRFRVLPDWRVRDVRFGRLSAGPGSGWEKRDRDAESMATAPDGTFWIGFEGENAIFRYRPDGGFDGRVFPGAMRRWLANGGPESLARLPDGRFVAIGESQRARRTMTRQKGKRRARKALLFARDPLIDRRPARFAYLPPAGFSPSDAAALPDGSLLVVNRRFRLPYRFVTVLTRVPAGALRAGKAAAGAPIATLDRPLLHDNFEGIAVTREGRDTIVWLVSDNNESMFQRTLLLKFRLEGTHAVRLP